MEKKKSVKILHPDESDPQPTRQKRSNYIRALVAYWILGLANNYGYVVMLSGAHDIINELEKQEDIPTNDRNCTVMSTGAILLADIIPSLAVKLVVPFFPFYIHCRIAVCIALAAGGLLLVAFGTVKWVAILGVVLTSMTSGLGELSLLQYSAFFDKNVISTWSSGTGGAGILGAVSYTIFSLLSTQAAMLIGLTIPGMMAVSFWVILPRPDPENVQAALQEQRKKKLGKSDWKMNFKMKIKQIPGLLKYMIPLVTVYLFEYFINQGIFELIFYEDIFIDHAFQYKVLQILYQVGVFISRSSVNIFHTKLIWLMSVLQFVNVILYTCEGIFYFVPSIWIIFMLTLWEGLLGGAAYVNTYYRISIEEPEEEKQFAMGMCAMSDSAGITLAGIIAIPLHNAICKLSKPQRLTF